MECDSRASLLARILTSPYFGRKPKARVVTWWFIPSLSHGESCESVYARGSFMHQKCSNYILTNLLFGLCISIWIINSLVIRLSLHYGTPRWPFYPQNAASKGTYPNSFSFWCFHFGTRISIFEGVWSALHTCWNKYTMPLPEEIFDAFGHVKVFNIFDLRSNYHQMPLKEGNKVKITFWGINPHGKDCLYEWRFLPFGLKNALAKFQKVLDWVLVRLGFTKCYIDDIIIFNLASEDHKHRL